MLNPDKLWDSLDKIEQKILQIVDDLDVISQSATGYSGDIARVLPVQLNASADVLVELINGSAQNSIKSLKDYVDNIPLGQLRTKSAGEAMRAVGGRAPSTPQVDLTPRTDTPQSAIANEDVDLSMYMKKKGKTVKKMNENGDFSFDAIMDECDIDPSLCDESNFSFDDAMIGTDDFSEFYDDTDLSASDDSFDFDSFETERLQNKDELSYEDAFDFGEELR